MIDALRVFVALIALSVVIAISDHAGLLETLPGAAFGWNALLHVERAAAVMGAVGLVVLIGARALKGEFPIKFGQVEYAQKQAKAAAGVTEAQERRLRVLEVLNQIRDPADI